MRKYIPVETLTTRLEKVRGKIAGLTQQIEDLKREEKILGALVDEAVEPGESEDDRPLAAGRGRGVVDGIVGFVQANPGSSKDELVEGLKYLNLNPFDQNAARRTILNNLGNLVRMGRIRSNEAGELFLTETKQAATG